MSNNESITKGGKLGIPAAENQKGIKNHKKIAEHLELAAKHHLDAARHHEVGEHEKAAHSTLLAYGHFSLAKSAQKEDLKHHTAQNA